jgi:sterol desaturase/sphingolipid hydroxylase (fatty acid hydroxylase superfamily)
LAYKTNMTFETIVAALAVGGTAIATGLLATFIQTSLHFALGHHRIGGWFFRSHIKCHHTIYSGKKLATPEYEDEETSLTLFYLIPSAVAVSIAYQVLPRALFWVHLGPFVVLFALHVYVHVQFHVRKSWLNRFGWFRRLRRLHNIHHLNHHKNYSLLQPFWDRLLGSYQASYPKTRRG